MRRALSSEVNPLDASLEKVMPRVHQWHQITNDSIMNFKNFMTDVHTDLKVHLEMIHGAILSTREDTKLELARMHMSMARQLLKGHVAVPATLMEASRESAECLVTQQTNTHDSDATRHEEVANAADNNEDPAENHKLYRMKLKHSNLHDIVKEWFGLDEFQDAYGGIDGRIKRYKSTTKWRKKCGIDPQHFSRTMRTIKAIEEHARRNNIEVVAAAQELEPHFVNCEKGLANFVKWSQMQGLLTKGAVRGKKVPGQQAVETDA